MLACRFYKNAYPKVEERVVCECNCTHASEGFLIVNLKEYNDLEGLVELGEWSKMAVIKNDDLLSRKSLEVFVVKKVDIEAGFIDLDKRILPKEEIEYVAKRWNKSKALHSVLRHVAKKHGVYVLQLYECFGWALYDYIEEEATDTDSSGDMTMDKWEHPWDMLKWAVAYNFALGRAATTPTAAATRSTYDLFCDDFGIPRFIRTTLFNEVTARIERSKASIHRNDLLVMVTNPKHGIDAVKKALKAGLELSTPDIPVSITVAQESNFKFSTESRCRKEGKKRLYEVIKRVKAVSDKMGGRIRILPKRPSAAAQWDGTHNKIQPPVRAHQERAKQEGASPTLEIRQDGSSELMQVPTRLRGAKPNNSKRTVPPRERSRQNSSGGYRARDRAVAPASLRGALLRPLAQLQCC